MSIEQVYFNKQISTEEKKNTLSIVAECAGRKEGRGKKRVPNQYRLFTPN